LVTSIKIRRKKHKKENNEKDEEEDSWRGGRRGVYVSWRGWRGGTHPLCLFADGVDVMEGGL
jgi:hypothetical protein